MPYQYFVTVEFSGGRLGNQLLEVATALAIAKDNNCIAVFPMFTEKDTWHKIALYGFPVEQLFASYLDDDSDAIFSHGRLGMQRDVSSLSCFTNVIAENGVDIYVVISDDIEYAKKLLQEAKPDLYKAGNFSS